MSLSKQRNIRREKFVDFYVETGNATEAARRAGYSEHTANEQGARLLAIANIQAAIEEKRRILSELNNWNLQTSSKEAINQYMALQAKNPGIAYKYKENLDKLHGLLIEHQIQEQKQTLPNIRKMVETGEISPAELQGVLLEHLRVSSQGVDTEDASHGKVAEEEGKST